MEQKIYLLDPAEVRMEVCELPRVCLQTENFEEDRNRRSLQPSRICSTD